MRESRVSKLSPALPAFAVWPMRWHCNQGVRRVVAVRV